MRNEKGIYFDAQATKADNGDKLFFMLDTLGEGTAVNNNNNLMFRFEKLDYGLVGQVQSRHTINSATRGYISLNNHPNISYTTTQMDTYVRVSMFVPYEMIKEIAPNATFDSFDDDLFFTVYGANSSFIENIIYDGNEIVWSKPNNYLILSKENEIIVRK